MAAHDDRPMANYDEVYGGSDDGTATSCSIDHAALGATRSRQSRPARRSSWRADELLAETFPEPRWAVPGVLCEGLNLLAGAPKVGKSWFALDVAVAVALGGEALGRFSVEPGDVLYLALEDTPRRMADRLRKSLGLSPRASVAHCRVRMRTVARGRVRTHPHMAR